MGGLGGKKRRLVEELWYCDELVAHGASLGLTPAAVVKKCKYTIAMLLILLQLFRWFLKKMEFWSKLAMKKGTLTCQQFWLIHLQRSVSAIFLQAITSKGGSFLEAPVSGSKKPAEDGQLIILAAGNKELYDEAIPALI
ncbi:Glyoxylate/succinic semialdehyde reductase 1-like protein [Drosera capensis]